MTNQSFSRPGLFALVASATFVATFAGRDAAATVTEPDGTLVPQMSSANEISTAAGQNSLAPYITLDKLFSARGETIDWQKDAKSKPDTFSPVCGFSAELILRGGGCRIDFGWYNVVPNHVPTDAEIYPLITAAQIAALPLEAFMPAVGQDGPSFSGADILKNPNYKGGQIGFATKGNSATVCTQTHYSQRDNNVLCTSGCGKSGDNDDHWAMAVIYKSTVDSNGYYIGFEDLPSSAMSFSPPSGSYKNDGDMNDFVFYITGVTCPGGGKHCATGMPGVCSEGINECQTGGALKCKPSLAPSPEKCDALDNDCNGMTDEGDDICPTGQKCVHGQCLGACSNSEFPCPATQVCDDTSGFCVDPTCLGVTCDQGTVCVRGVCKGPCDDVKCPIGQQCHGGRCSDPCDGITCAADRVCKDGACVARCECLACDDGFACQTTTGKCVDKGCETMMCPAGQLCSMGKCMDACAGVMCASDQECKMGRCTDLPKSATGGSNGNPGTGGSSGTGGAKSGGAPGSGGAGTGGASGTGGAKGMPGSGGDGEMVKVNGCSCALGEHAPTGIFASFGVLGAALALALRRRR